MRPQCGPEYLPSSTSSGSLSNPWLQKFSPKLKGFIKKPWGKLREYHQTIRNSKIDFTWQIELPFKELKCCKFATMQQDKEQFGCFLQNRLWLVVSTPLKNMSSSIRMMTFPYMKWKVIKFHGSKPPLQGLF